jgi:alpha-glucosidase
MMLRNLLATVLVGMSLGVPGAPAQDQTLSLTSPDGRLSVTFDIRDGDGQSAVPAYTIARDGATLVTPSRLGLILPAESPAAGAVDGGLEIVSTHRDSNDTTWEPVYGERSRVRDHYQRMVVQLQSRRSPHVRWSIEWRAYDEGIAFCYHVPQQETLDRLQVEREQSEFRFPADHEAWAVYSAQGVYQQTRLSALKRGCERPLVIRAADDCYLAIAEARLVDFARMKLAPLAGQQYALVSELSGPAVCALPFRSPWRVVMVADSPGRLLENNDLLRNLNDPCAIEDTAWIKPGKVIREVTLTTDGGKACVDFAAANGLQYVEFDAGWYGHEYEDASDATTITVDPKRSPGPLDLQEVIRYADQHGIGILVYVNRRALEKQLDEILPLYQQWGIKGVKYGFVNVGSQQWTTWLHEAVRKAAQHQLMVDVHDEYRPTGYSRTYPNLMTQEGIGGDETSPTNEQTLTILFTRMLAGAGDNTICYYNSRVEEKASHAYQLAKSVCIYSPWQFVYWYDRPLGSPGTTGGAGGQRGVIGDEPELEFFAHVPTVWDETRVVHGQIGQYAVIARRSGHEWYVGAMNDGQARTLDLPLDFLDSDRRYTAHIYSDDPTVPTRTHVRIDRRPVDARTVWQIELAPRCGQAIRIVCESH